MMIRHNAATRAFFVFLGLCLAAAGAWRLRLDVGAVSLDAGQRSAIVAGATDCYGTDKTPKCPGSTDPAACSDVQCTEVDLTCPGNNIVPTYVCEWGGEYLFSSTNESLWQAYDGAASGNEGVKTGTIFCGFIDYCDGWAPTCDNPQTHCAFVADGQPLVCGVDQSNPNNFASSWADPNSPACKAMSGWLRARGPSDPLFAAAVFNGIWFSAVAGGEGAAAQ